MPYQRYTLQLLTFYILFEKFPFWKVKQKHTMRALWCGFQDIPAIMSLRRQKLCMASEQGDKSSPVGSCSDMKANKPKQSQKQTPKKNQNKTKSQNSLQILKDFFVFVLFWSSGNIICASASAVSASADEHLGFKCCFSTCQLGDLGKFLTLSGPRFPLQNRDNRLFWWLFVKARHTVSPQWMLAG